MRVCIQCILILCLYLQFLDDAKCDVWSIGVISYMLLSGRPPFEGKEYKEVLKNVIKGTWDFDDHSFQIVSDSAKDFITKCLTVNIDDRPTSAEALLHPWFKLLKEDKVDKEVSLDIVERLQGNIYTICVLLFYFICL